MIQKIDLSDLNQHINTAVSSFWAVRNSQGESQGKLSGKKDTGNRSSVTGGKHLDGFIEMFSDLLKVHCPKIELYKQAHVRDPSTVLPGFYRPTKMWDLVVIHKKQLVACLELKSHIGPSFGNNYNNRSEEAVGVGHDLQVAYREGAFEPSPKPWVGYLMLLEEATGSTRPVEVKETHFEVFEEFKGASYAERYRIGIKRLVREGLYDAASLILTSNEAGKVVWREPDSEIVVSRLVASLAGHCMGVMAG